VADDMQNVAVARSRARRRQRREARNRAFEREQQRALESVNPRMFGHSSFVRWTHSLQRPGARRNAFVLVAAAILVAVGVWIAVRPLV